MTNSDQSFAKVVPFGRDGHATDQPSDGAETHSSGHEPPATESVEAPKSPSPDVGFAANEAWDAAKIFMSRIGVLARAAYARGQAKISYVVAKAAGLTAVGASRVATKFGARSRSPQWSRLRSVGARWAALVFSPLAPLLRRSALRYAFAASLAGVLLGFAFLGYCVATIPIDGGLEPEATQNALTLQSDRGETFATRGVFKGEKLTGAEFPPHLAQAIVAIEDRRFYQHSGVDLRGVLRAAFRNAQAGATREGGSTITQQLARLLFLSPERTMRRKVQEALLALWLESQLSKEEILSRYLNTAFFGAGAYGADAAAKRYFGKRAKELSLSESAMLAGLVRAPSQLAPTRNFGGARERAETVLQAMADMGAITPEEAQAAAAQSVVLRTPPETPPGSNYFVDMVAGEVRRLLGPAAGDVTLRTTLNLELQRLAEGVVERRLEAEGGKKNVTQAALVAMRPDGAILALVGGRDYETSQFNRAVQARRQAGSLFKLFVYMTAFQRGHHPRSVIVDRPVQIGEWEPQNANGRFRGAVNLKTAFAQSINTVAAQLADELGIPAIIEMAKRMGVQSNLPAVPSLALGSADVTLLEMTRAFAAVLTGLESVEPYAIEAISGGSRQTLYTRPKDSPQLKDQLGESRAMMLELLQAVVTEGTGKAARLPDTPVGGKTGTSQDYRDAWFIGFTPELVTGVWVGNDDNTPMRKVVGGDLPVAIWRDFMSRAAPLMAQKSPPVSRASERTTTGSAQLPDQAPEAVRGAPRVIDTGTFEIGGAVVRLLGVEGEGGRMASRLARLLRRQEVVCKRANGADAHQCRIGDEDLSELILSGGGARAKQDASARLLAAEESARAARLGIWRGNRR